MAPIKTLYLYQYTSGFLLFLSILILLFSVLTEITPQSMIACVIGIFLSIYLRKYKVIFYENSVVLKSPTNEDKELSKPITLKRISSLKFELYNKHNSCNKIVFTGERHVYARLLENL